MGGAADDTTASAALPQARAAGRYVRLVRFNIRHDYYNADADSPGVCRDFEMAPSPQTKARMAMFGFFALQRDDGLDIIWDSDQIANATALFTSLSTQFGAVPTELRNTLFEPPLLFTLGLRNDAFANFTDMPSNFRPGAPPIRLSNDVARINNTHNAELVIDWSRTIARPVPPPHPLLAFRAEIAAGTPRPRPAKKSPPEPVSHVPIPGNAATVERERYEANAEHFALIDFRFARPASQPPVTSGWSGYPIDIDAPRDPAAALTTRSFFRPCSYDIRFGRRSTTWRYFVASRSGDVAPASLEIVDSRDGGDAGFVRLDTPRTLPDGRPAVCFTSRQPIALLERPLDRFALTGLSIGGQRRTRTLVDPLPAPGIARIAPFQAAITAPRPGAPAAQPPPIWSDIYVFV